MTNERIDELLEILSDRGFIVEIMEFVDDENLRIDDDIFTAILPNIMKQIENEGFNYLCSKISEHPDLEFLFLGLTEYENIIKCIEDENLISDNDIRLELIKQLHDLTYVCKYLKTHKLSRNDEIELICSTGDIKYLKTYLEENNLELYNVQKILLKINEKDYANQWIANHRKWFIDHESILADLLYVFNDLKYIEDNWINNDNIESKLKILLVRKSNNKEYIKSYIQNNADELEKDDLVTLIITTKDSKYIKDWIENEHLLLTSRDRILLIETIDDQEYTKECINNEKLKLERPHLMQLLNNIKDQEYIYEILKENKFEFSYKDKIMLLRKFERTFIKRCIYSVELNLSDSEKAELISWLGYEFIIKCIEDKDLGLSKDSIVKLLIKVPDDDYINKCITGNEFDREEKIRIIKSHSEGYIYSCLRNNMLDFSEMEVELLLDEIYSAELKEQILEFEDLLIPLATKVKFLLDTGKELPVDEFPWMRYLTDKNNINDVKEDIKYGKTINLPPNMTIGIEIESEGKNSDYIMDNCRFAGWENMHDGSLIDGVEITSPILTATSDDAKRIYIVTEMLKGMGQTVSENCGGHIHIGANYLTQKAAWINLIELWCNTEIILYAICNKEGEPPRKYVIGTAKPISTNVQEAFDKSVVQLNDEEDLELFCEELKNMQRKTSEIELDFMTFTYDRYYGMNFDNLGPGGIQTIEFRIPNGTLDPDLWIDNINLFGGMMAIAQELAEIQELKNPSFEQKRKLELFENISEFRSNQEKLEILLELIGLQPENYRRRFESNIRFVINNEELVERTSKGSPVIIKAKEKSIITIEEIGEIGKTAKALEQSEAREQIVSDLQERNISVQR